MAAGRWALAAALLVLCADASPNGSTSPNFNFSGWNISALPHAWDSEAFDAFMEPLAKAITLTYTATIGSSYFHPWDANRTVPGFAKSELTHDPPGGGMRALVFVDAEGGRVLLAFRGTDLNTSEVSGMADACADARLTQLASRAEMPPFCAQFSDATIDYYSAAVRFATAVRARYPPPLELLITGHSLGAALAVLVGAALQAREQGGTARPAPVVALAQPPTAYPFRLAARTAAIAPGSAFSLADGNDPVQRAAEQQPGGLVGAGCTWPEAPPPPPCVHCNYTEQMNTGTCLACMLEFHVLSVYLRLLKGQRPRCESSASSAAATSVAAATAEGAASAGTWRPLADGRVAAHSTRPNAAAAFLGGIGLVALAYAAVAAHARPLLHSRMDCLQLALERRRLPGPAATWAAQQLA